MFTKTAFSAFSIYPKVTLTYKNIHTHAAFFSENPKFSTVDSILTKIMVYFEDKTNRKKKKKKTAALLLYTQLEHDKIILQEQHHLLQVFGLFIIMLSFKQHSVFFLVELYPLQFSTNESFIYIYYKLKNSFVAVSCERYIEIQPNCHREI